MVAVCNLSGCDEVYVLSTEGSARQITNAAAIPGAIVEAEDGDTKPDGTVAKERLAREDHAVVMDAALSPDGDWVAYGLDTPGDEGWGIWVRSANGEADTRRLTAGALDAHPCWSPGSKRIAFARRRGNATGLGADDIWMVGRDEPGSEDILVKLDGQWSIHGLAWSPDGKTIVFTRAELLSALLPSGKPRKGGLLRHSIWSLDLDSGKVARIPIEAESASRPAWFPDGSRIVYSALKEHPGRLQLYTCKPDGSDEKLLVGTQYSTIDPTVSPDGRYVAFLARFGWPRAFPGWHGIGIVDVNTGEVKELTARRKVSWRSLSWSRDPRAAEAGEGEEPQAGFYCGTDVERELAPHHCRVRG
jgi:Tol biopolymer transport system component